MPLITQAARRTADAAELWAWERGIPPKTEAVATLDERTRRSTQAHSVLALYRWRLGRWQESEDLLSRQLRGFESGKAYGAIMFLPWAPLAADARGDFATADDLTDLLLAGEADLDTPFLAAPIHADVAIRRVRTAELDQAEAELRTALASAGPLDAWRGRSGTFHLAEGLIALHRSGPEAARPMLEAALAAFGKYEAKWWQADALFLWGEALRRAEHADAGKTLRESLDVYQQLQAGAPWLERVQAELSLVEG